MEIRFIVFYEKLLKLFGRLKNIIIDMGDIPFIYPRFCLAQAGNV